MFCRQTTDRNNKSNQKKKKKAHRSLPQPGPYVESMDIRQAGIEWRGISEDTAGKMSGPSPHPFSTVRYITFKISLTSFRTIA